jgi:hypothetical protein
MPSIPESTRGSITWRLILHAEKNWPQLTRVQVRYHGSFAYVTGTLPGGEQIPLFRLRYGGSAHSFGFAIYSAAHDRYEDAVLLTGLPAGTPQEALDTAATVHLAALGHQPPQNLQRGPLKLMALPVRGCNCTRSFASQIWPYDVPAGLARETDSPAGSRGPVASGGRACRSRSAGTLGATSRVISIQVLAASRMPPMTSVT